MKTQPVTTSLSQEDIDLIDNRKAAETHSARRWASIARHHPGWEMSDER